MSGTALDVLEAFKRKPYLLRMGSKKVAKQLKTSIQAVKGGRLLHKKRISMELFPKILIFDIETAPARGFIWKLWKENIGLDQLIDDWFMFTWSAKWLFKPEIFSDRLTTIEAIEQDDSRIVTKLRDLLMEAQIVVAHNGKKFDVPKLNSRMLYNGLNPVTPFQLIDTLLVARQSFGEMSNKLDALARKLGIDTKIETNFKLWKDCYVGDPVALMKMEQYNQKDVKILEDVYLKLRPWMKSHPNIGLFLERDHRVCSVCGSSDVTLDEKSTYNTQVSKFPVYICGECGTPTRSRQNIYPKEDREVLNVSIAR